MVSYLQKSLAQKFGLLNRGDTVLLMVQNESYEDGAASISTISIQILMKIDHLFKCNFVKWTYRQTWAQIYLFKQLMD